MSEDDRMVRVTLDSFSVHIALVDASGEIVLTNGAWRRFARANGTPPIRDRGPHLGLIAFNPYCVGRASFGPRSPIVRSVSRV